MTGTKIELPVPVLEKPHWRVQIHPSSYNAELIPTLDECFKIVRHTKVSLRGWDYPHLSNRKTEQNVGKDWVASWSDFLSHLEYWRLYQSGQFIHLFSVREVAEKAYFDDCLNNAKAHIRDDNVDWDKVPGFINIVNFIYTVTEIFEFASRLCQTTIWKSEMEVSIKLNGIKGFVLTAGLDRIFFDYYAASEDVLGHTWTIPADVLIAESENHSLEAIRWFFERFGWLGISRDVLRQDQDRFLKRVV